MKVHLLSYEDGHGRTPIPNWPNSSVDPFGEEIEFSYSQRVFEDSNSDTITHRGK